MRNLFHSRLEGNQGQNRTLQKLKVFLETMFLPMYSWWSQQQTTFLTFLPVLLVSSCIEKQRNTTDCHIAHHIPWWRKWKWPVISKIKGKTKCKRIFIGWVWIMHTPCHTTSKSAETYCTCSFLHKCSFYLFVMCSSWERNDCTTSPEHLCRTPIQTWTWVT